MVTVEEVDKYIANSLINLGTETINLEDAVGRVLQQQVVADRDFPPFNRVMMDGIAIQFALWENGKRSFNIEGLAAAGIAQHRLRNAEGCLEVMTGAVLPENTDTVVQYEHLIITAGKAVIGDEYILKVGQHIHNQGSDRSKREVLLQAGRVISPAEIGVMATVGIAEVTVARSAKVAVIATGDELIDIEKTPDLHQIRKSNVHSLIASLREHNFKAEAFHFKDDMDGLRTGLKEILDSYDVLVLSGGVSRGKFDYVPEILAELGVAEQFHFVKQRPGKPFWFGRHKKAVVFALPGNPVASFVGLYRYVIPFLYCSMGVEPKVAKAMLTADFTFKPNLTYFLQVKLNYSNDGHLLATPVPGHGSGDLANLLTADAFLGLPSDTDVFKKGEVFSCYWFRKM